MILDQNETEIFLLFFLPDGKWSMCFVFCGRFHANQQTDSSFVRAPLAADDENHLNKLSIGQSSEGEKKERKKNVDICQVKETTRWSSCLVLHLIIPASSSPSSILLFEKISLIEFVLMRSVAAAQNQLTILSEHQEMIERKSQIRSFLAEVFFSRKLLRVRPRWRKTHTRR